MAISLHLYTSLVPKLYLLVDKTLTLLAFFNFFLRIAFDVKKVTIMLPFLYEDNAIDLPIIRMYVSELLW